MTGRGRDWRGESLEHLRLSWPSWLTSYDIARKLRGGAESVTRTGRDAQRIREACEVMVTEGLLERKAEYQEGAPYGKPYMRYRYRKEEDNGE